MKDNGTVRYKVAEAARLAGVSASTLRLWESQGLVVPTRSETGHRQYSGEDVARLKRIAWLRSERGLNPAAIRAALEAEEAPPKPDAAFETDMAAQGPEHFQQRRETVLRPELRKSEETERSRGSKTSEIALGRKLRSLRHGMGRTLEEVAADVGVAASVLSTLERTSQGVTFKVLHDLADYYGTTVSRLSGEDSQDSRELVRGGEWRVWPATTPGVTVQLLAEGRLMMDCHRFVLAPGAASEGAYRHEGEEFVHVLSGRLEMVLDSDQFFDLGPGDSLYFASHRHHAWRNAHDGETVLLWINTPPTF